ncbi:MAG: arginine repressor [Clostridia bacterium]|nr:arginine repressor [Clostridia bacterium]
MKSARQEKILEIIEEYEVSTQEALIARLAEHGFDSTQTTISRDIRQLKLVKTPTGRGTYKYAAPKDKKEISAPGHNSALADSVLKIEAAQNIVVIKTHAGMANAIAVCLDTLEVGEIVGSVAGDDTILLVMKDSQCAIETERALKLEFIQ